MNVTFNKVQRAQVNRPEHLWKFAAIEDASECWLWRRWVDRDGYGEFSVGGQKHKAHRLAFELATGINPGNRVVCHSCDTPSCINPSHLFLGSQADNMADKAAKGRAPRGIDHPHARLTPTQVTEIRSRRAAGEKGCDLAAEFGVSQATISDANSGKRYWRHVA